MYVYNLNYNFVCTKKIDSHYEHQVASSAPPDVILIDICYVNSLKRTELVFKIIKVFFF